MTEIDREAVLYERAQARQARAERKALERKVRDLERQEQAQQRATQPDRKRSGLEALRAARDRKQRKADRASDDSDYVDSDAEVEEEGQVKEMDYGEEDEEEEGEELRRPFQRKISKSSKKATEEALDFELANRLRLSRNNIVQWIYHPDFDELARGTLLRLAIGPDARGEQVYRLVEVKKVVPYHRTYRIGNTAITKGAILRYGKSERTFRFDVVSNSEFTEKEYGRWRAILQDEQIAPPSKRTAQSKAAAWEAFLAAPVSDEAVQAMVTAKRDAGNAHRNLVAERTTLLAQREEAEAAGNTEEMEQIDTELVALARELEASQSKRQGSSRLEALAEINRRNRQLNVSIAREAERISATQRETGPTGARMDPFSRRKCQPTSFHDFNDQEQQPPQPTATAEPVKSSQPTTPQKPKKADLFSVHDVDIDIDI
jgi:RNA polymerase-associated protein RTF1